MMKSLIRFQTNSSAFGIWECPNNSILRFKGYVII